MNISFLLIRCWNILIDFLKFTNLHSRSNINSTLSLQDKIILVSGSSSGIGYNMAKHFAENCGSIVIVCSRNIENAIRASKNINGKTYAISLDVTDTNNIHNQI